jgi:hypothetical protein
VNVYPPMLMHSVPSTNVLIVCPRGFLPIDDLRNQIPLFFLNLDFGTINIGYARLGNYARSSAVNVS